MVTGMGMGMVWVHTDTVKFKVHVADMVLTGIGDQDDHGSYRDSHGLMGTHAMPRIHPHSKEKQSASFVLRCICGACLPLPHQILLRRPCHLTPSALAN